MLISSVEGQQDSLWGWQNSFEIVRGKKMTSIINSLPKNIFECDQLVYN